MSQGEPNFSCRSVFISDVHLGTRGCQAEMLLDFIRHLECDHLYLVGDIIDGWKLKGGWHWPQSHNDVVQKVLRMARKGVQVTYVPGNHDERARDFCGVHFGGVVVARDAIHETADGRRLDRRRPPIPGRAWRRVRRHRATRPLARLPRRLVL